MSLSGTEAHHKKGVLGAGKVLDIQIDGTSITIKTLKGDLTFPVTIPAGKELHVELSMNLMDAET